MVILKKIQSSTLIESLIATVIIIVVFMMGSMIVNSLFFNTFYDEKELLLYRLDELEYKYINKSIQLPHTENLGPWYIEIVKLENSSFAQLKAINLITNKEIDKKIYVFAN